MSLFNFILIVRHLAAVAVIFSHSFILYDGRSDDPLRELLGVDAAFLAVLVFFALSGRLIYMSFLYSTNLTQYTLKRCLRIIPALVACVLITIFAASCLSGDPLAFIQSKGWVSYSLNIFFVGGYTLPIVFDVNPYPYVANGSLWTLRYEALMYAVIPIIFLFKNYRKFALITCVIVLVIASCILPDERSFFVNFLRLGVAFFVGALFAELESIFEVIGVGLVLSSLVCFLVFLGLEAEVVFAFFIALLFSCVIYFAKWSVGRKWDWDYSYGIYIYGFFSQQVLEAIYDFDGVLEFFATSVVVSIILGWLSWTLVERPFLRLKKAI